MVHHKNSFAVVKPSFLAVAALSALFWQGSAWSQACSSKLDSAFGGGEFVDVHNYTNFAPESPEQTEQRSTGDWKSFFSSYYVKTPASTPNELQAREKAARQRLAALYKNKWFVGKVLKNDGTATGACADDMFKQIASKKPNVYIYTGGFGQHVQLNDNFIDAGWLVNWINQTDPDALIISIAWDCDAANNSSGIDPVTHKPGPGSAWCKQKAKALQLPQSHPIAQSVGKWTMEMAKLTAADGGMDQKKAMSLLYAGMKAQNGDAYNDAYAHAMEQTAYLINNVIEANIGDVHLIGYSLGAHNTADVMAMDFSPKEGGKGFKWSSKVCKDGSDTCVVSQVKQVKSALAMGTPGWSDTLRTAVNKFDETTGKESADRDAARAQYDNGGIYVVPDNKAAGLFYEGKLTVMNKRNDPTSIKDDNFQRGMDGFLAEYNHNGHDYIRFMYYHDQKKPMDQFFPWVKKTAQFVDSYRLATSKGKKPKPLFDYGIVLEACATLDFDECTGATCNPNSYYPFHSSQNPPSHAGMHPMQSLEKIKVADSARGLSSDGQDGVKDRAASFVGAGAKTFRVYTMDQEDLRGGVEFAFKPSFDPASDTDEHGLFGYEQSAGDDDKDLLPRAYFKDKKLNFEIQYAGETYKASVDVSNKKELAANKWSHLSFGWSLPTESVTQTYKGKTDDEKAQMLSDAADAFGPGLAVGVGMLKAPHTTWREQRGAGKLSIYVNGKQAATAPLGNDDSKRPCLNAKDVIGQNVIKLLNAPRGVPAFDPWGFTSEKLEFPVQNAAANGSEVTLKARICKGFKIRGNRVTFGNSVAGESAATAQGLMDDVRVIYGEPRNNFPEIDFDADRGNLNWLTWAEAAGV